MKSRELLRQLVECHFFEHGVGTYITGDYSEDIWGVLREHFKAERIKGVLDINTEYLYFFGESGIEGMQDEIVLQNKWGKVFLYKM